MADVKKTLPPSVGQSQGIGQILDSCDKELDRLEDAARTACQRLTRRALPLASSSGRR